MQRALSFDHLPPLALPMRFLMSVPLFAALAAGLLAWHGEAALVTRWSPLTLALTHLLTLGCLSMAMIGALLQILPVMAGIAVPGGSRTANTMHGALCAGTLLLAAAFLVGHALLFAGALACLGVAFFLLLGCCTIGLWQQFPGGADASLAAIRLALGALVVTVVLGLWMGAALAWPRALPPPLSLPLLADLHAAWGLLGWVALLIVGVAFQVVPMFLVTEPYPRWISGGYTTMLFLLLVASSLSAGIAGPFRHAALLLLGAGYVAFAWVTLRLLARRKRPRADAATLFWRTAMLALPAALARGLLPADPALDVACGVLLVVGFALSTINGMTYKIVPFLSWYHLRHAHGMGLSGGAPASVPPVHRMLPDGAARGQYLLHAAALLALVAACAWPAQLARPAGALLCVSCLAWFANLAAALRAGRVPPAARGAVLDTAGAGR
ncbi:permease [Pseudoduganella albidiflava]|uniref:Permease n=1 Tax=Pseudoduganella albidiflava TaxID=321983 RepID=A0A411WXQ9_9BURK|nr:permease [Pseudoduganella albidiflava]QBI01484.1 permease [Pseudoduganella albidiflava]GGY35377.1 hypothetical protein GCM10007387_16750 [Pseudoduganella albidiflava]